MVTTRERKLKKDVDLSQSELAGGIGVPKAAEPAPKRRRIKKSRPAEDDPAIDQGPSSGKGKGTSTTQQAEKQLITRRGGKGGKLRDLMNMPVDIFTEICSYLHPYDLRRLSLTNKRLWGILMTKEARHIWKIALASVSDLPECPTDLNEPQYVCLLYSSECYTLGCTSRGIKVDWFHRVRFCSTCHGVRMTNERNLKYRRDADLGLKNGTSAIMQSYFDSYPVMRMATRYTPYRHWRVARSDGPYCYMEVVKKAGLEYDALSHEKATEYLGLLKERRNYRVKTGIALVRWENTQLASRAREIAAEKDTRYASIKANLSAMGWEEKDFPMDKKAFRDLVLKDQKLTPKVWQNIKPKLEPMLEKSRLERGRILRRRNRDQAVRSFYHQMSREITDLPFDITEMGFFNKHFEVVLALQPIKALLENDTETITEEQWADVASDARLAAVTWWRDSLKQLVDRLENGSTPEPGGTNTEVQGAVGPERETIEDICESIEVLKAKLSKATSVFCCTVNSCKRTSTACFLQSVRHVFSVHKWYKKDGLFQYMQPLRPDGQKLVKRLLEDLKFDPETVQSSEVVSEDQSQKDFLCTRCDERVARYMTFGELIEHYLDHQKWFENVTETVRNSPDSCYPFWLVNSELPTMVNDHDWISCDELLVRKDDYKKRDEVIKLQNEFFEAELNDPTCETKGVVLRSCLLCPALYGPRPLATGEIKLHIQLKHGKVPDLESDTTVDQIYPSNPCPR